MSAQALTGEMLEQEVMNSRSTVLIDFWAEWCGPCRMIAPIIDEIADMNLANVKVFKVNVDSEPELAGKFGIMSIPTLVVMKCGKRIATAIGVKSKQDIINMLV